MSRLFIEPNPISSSLREPHHADSGHGVFPTKLPTLTCSTEVSHPISKLGQCSGDSSHSRASDELPASRQDEGPCTVLDCRRGKFVDFEWAGDLCRDPIDARELLESAQAPAPSLTTGFPQATRPKKTSFWKPKSYANSAKDPALPLISINSSTYLFSKTNYRNGKD